MMDDPNMYAYGDHYPDDSDQPLPLPPEGHPLRKLGQRLTELLDEDHWAECERLLLEGWEHDRIDRKTGAVWRQNSSLEIWFPFTAKELARWKRAAEANIEENVRLRCWWFGCEPHPQDPAPPDEITCMHCGRNVPYGDMVGDTIHNRTMDWLRYWMWRRWLPEKCPACGARYGHRGNCDGIPF